MATRLDSWRAFCLRLAGRRQCCRRCARALAARAGARTEIARLAATKLHLPASQPALHSGAVMASSSVQHQRDGKRLVVLVQALSGNRDYEASSSRLVLRRAHSARFCVTPRSPARTQQVLYLSLTLSHSLSHSLSLKMQEEFNSTVIVLKYYSQYRQFRAGIESFMARNPQVTWNSLWELIYERIDESLHNPLGLNEGWDDEPPQPDYLWSVIESKIRNLTNGVPH